MLGSYIINISDLQLHFNDLKKYNMALCPQGLSYTACGLSQNIPEHIIKEETLESYGLPLFFDIHHIDISVANILFCKSCSV